VSEPPVPVSRWTGLGEVIRRAVIATVAAAVAVGALGGSVGWATGRGVWSIMAAAYYMIGCLLFLIGMFPSGGFSLMRGTLTRRRPTGARQEPIFLLGLVLIALGILVDVTRPF
jgi:hypothetical protein